MFQPMRMGGLATGMDTENMIKQMMRPYQMRVDKVKQDRELIQWRQELYRDMLTDMNKFKRSYFDVLNGESYMLSKEDFSTYNVEGLTGNSVKVVGNSGAKAGNYKLDVTQIAEGAKVEGTGVINNVTVGKPSFGIKIDENNNEFKLKLADGTLIDFKIPVNEVTGFNRYNSASELASEINKLTTKIPLADGNVSDKVKAVVKDGNIEFMTLTKVEADNKIKFNHNGEDFEFSISAGNYTAEELLAQINSKVKSVKGSNGGEFPKNSSVVVDIESDSAKFSIKDDLGNKVGLDIFNKGEKLDIKTPALNVDGQVNTNNTDIKLYSSNTLAFENKIIEGFNDTLNVRIGTEIKTVKLTAGVFSNDADIEKNFNDALLLAGITEDDLKVEMKEGKVNFTSKSGKQISIYGNASKVFGTSDNFNISMDSNNKMSNILTGEVEFRINDVKFSYDFSGADKDKTISNILKDIKDKTGLDMTYSESSKKFTLSSNETGASSSIYVQDTKGKFFDSILGDGTDAFSGGKTFAGKDAIFTLTDATGQSSEYAKAMNNFTIDGVNYTLNSKTEGSVNFTLSGSTDKTFNKIKDFVEKYNELIDKVSNKVEEKRQYKYKPLTSEQRKDMKENEIKLWEDRAKEGILKGDQNLRDMLNELRGAFFYYDKDMKGAVDGVDLNLSDIGITTSSDTAQRGKLIINEEKLKEALKNKSDEVADLFTKKSDTYKTYNASASSTERNTRFREEGIFQRINDIFMDYTRTTRDINGKKGILIEKAGIKGDFSERTNLLSDEIKEKDDKIYEMERKLIERENRYYMQFAMLEKAMQKANSQSAWFAQQFGGAK